jgi:hypothetical protein
MPNKSRTAARAHLGQDITFVDAYSSSHCGLVLPWQSSELHRQLFVHSQRGASRGGEYGSGLGAATTWRPCVRCCGWPAMAHSVQALLHALLVVG